MKASCLALLLAFVALPAQGGSFARWHPDQHYLELAMRDFQEQRFAQAHEYFRTAARYGEKSSQLAVALMLREGLGVPRDPALAYVWADLAAERGYPDFLAVREAIWAELDAAARARALAEGPAVFEEYADAVAKPRLEQLLHRGMAQKTGTRTGSGTGRLGLVYFGDGAARAAFLSVFLPSLAQGRGSGLSAGAAAAAAATGKLGDYYAEANWEPAQYWQARDSLWLDIGTVTVEPLRKPDAGGDD